MLAQKFTLLSVTFGKGSSTSPFPCSEQAPALAAVAAWWGRSELGSHLHTFCLILNAGWWSRGSLGTNQTHSGLMSFNLFAEGGTLNCCLSCKSLLHKGPIILIFLGLLARFSRLAACTPVTKAHTPSVISFLTYLKSRERICPEFSGGLKSSLSNCELFWDRPV